MLDEFVVCEGVIMRYLICLFDKGRVVSPFDKIFDVLLDDGPTNKSIATAVSLS